MKRKNISLTTFAYILLAAVLFSLKSNIAFATIYTVNSTAATTTGSGTAGTLRYCVNQVNTGSGGDIINFSVTGTISLANAITLSKSVTIDGTTAPGYTNTPLVQVANGASVTTAFTISAENCVIKGLSVTGFGTRAFQVATSGNTISLCYIGVNLSGAASANGTGINITADGNTIGGINAGNVISGNTTNGINISSAGNTVQGNIIGLNAAGNAALGNITNGITLGTGANTNTIGGTSAGTGNVIAGNTAAGILIQGSATGNMVQGNIIGMNAAGTASIPNGENGIQLNSSAATNTIGGSAAGAGNCISGNTGNGIHVSSTGNTIQGNIIGLNAAGTAPVANSINGIQLNSNASATIIGGASSGSRNYISGNSSSGIAISSIGNTIQGNIIGLDTAGTDTVANGSNGITLNSGANTNIIGGTSAGTGNIISGNRGNGITITSSDNTINGNIIGLNKAGTAARANGTNGITLNARANTIGGSGAGNYISGNTNSGIGVNSSSNTIQGNTIGMNTAGTAAIANGNNGITLNSGADTNTIGGGAVAGTGNFISGNISAGINVSSSRNTIQGNTIGINTAGNAAIPNGTNGITLNTGANTNTIGGTATAARNYISGNTGSGILAQGTSTENTIMGNTIGMDITGSTPLPNGVNGIQINSGAVTNIIGGTAAGTGNLISGNTGNGIHVSSTGITIQGNVIGLNADGTAPVGNSNNGIQVNSGATGTVIGGTAAGAGNIISGNAVSGINVISTGNMIQGNIIGMNATGDAAAGNGTNGITLNTGANTNTIGGTAAAARNYISGNSAAGILLQGTSTGNTIQGNSIGIDVAGKVSIANGSGIQLNSGAGTNTIGGAAAGAGNIISGNTNSGIDISSTGNTIQGNTIGLDAAGDGAIANGSNGIILNSGAGTNTIGGSGTGMRNIISGNTAAGISVSSTADTIQGNIIGMNAMGSAALANDNGIILEIGANTNIIGGSATGAGNYISGNTSRGIIINSTDNTIQGNTIGLNTTGTAAIPNATGIQLNAGTNTIGGTVAGAGNIVSGNTNSGIYISSADNTIQGNIIGMNAAVTTAMPNNYGITLNGSSNTIGGSTAGAGNVIAANTVTGVDIFGGSNNKISRNAIYGNGSIGIDLQEDGPTLNDAFDADSGPNNLVNFPAITSIAQGGGNTTVSGTYDGAASTAFTIEFFGNSVLDPSGYGEGETYIGSTVVTTDGAGHGIFSTVITGIYNIVTATATDAANNTSEFSYSALEFVNSTPQVFTLCQDAGDSSIKSLLRVADAQLGQTITWYVASEPSHGTVNLSGATASSGSSNIIPGGTITYNPMNYTGTDAFTIEATDGTNTVSMVVNVTVHPIQPVAGSDTVTFGLTTTLTDPVPGGTWSTPTPWITKVGAATGDVKGVSAGVSVITYTTIPGCTATHTVTVMSGINACVGQTIAISDGIATGGTWTSSSNSIATVGINTGIISGVAAGNAVITHKLSSGAMTTTTVKVNPLAATTAMPTSVCQGQTLAMNNTTAGGGTWYSGNTATAVISAGGSVLGVAGGNVTIYFTPHAGCATTKTITILPVVPITGPTSVCVGQIINLTNTVSGGTWSTSNGSMATVYNGIIGGVAAGSPNISYRMPNGCFTSAAITVKALSNITGGSAIICQNAIMTLTNLTPGGGAWSSDNKFSVNSGGLVTPINTGTGFIYFNANNGCVATRTVTVNEAPVIGGLPSVCAGQTTLLNSSMTGGTWSTSNGSMATVYNGLVGGVAAGTPNISYKMPTGCFGIAAVTVRALSPITGGSSSICPSGTTTYTNATPGGGAWSSSAPAVANISGAGLVTGAGAAPGSRTVISFTANNACVTTRTVTIAACRDGGNTTETETIAAPAIFNLQLYPNPNKGFFTLKGTIDVTAGEEANVEVVNMLGQVIYRNKVNVQNGNIEEQIQLQGNLASGTYILNLRTGSGNKLFHFVVGQ